MKKYKKIIGLAILILLLCISKRTSGAVTEGTLWKDYYTGNRREFIFNWNEAQWKSNRSGNSDERAIYFNKSGSDFSGNFYFCTLRGAMWDYQLMQGYLPELVTLTAEASDTENYSWEGHTESYNYTETTKADGKTIVSNKSEKESEAYTTANGIVDSNKDASRAVAVSKLDSFDKLKKLATTDLENKIKAMKSDTENKGNKALEVIEGSNTYRKQNGKFTSESKFGEQEGYTYAFWGQYGLNKFTYSAMQRATRVFSETIIGSTETTEDPLLKNTVEGYMTFYANSVNNQLNVNKDEKNATLNISGKDYMIGPFIVNYDQEIYANICFSWIDSVTITSQSLNKTLIYSNENTNGEFQITDKDGNKLYNYKMTTDKSGTITRINAPKSGEEFYIKCSYDSHDFRTKGTHDLHITFNFNYISGYNKNDTNATEWQTIRSKWGYPNWSKFEYTYIDEEGAAHTGSINSNIEGSVKESELDRSGNNSLSVENKEGSVTVNGGSASVSRSVTVKSSSYLECTEGSDKVKSQSFIGNISGELLFSGTSITLDYKIYIDEEQEREMEIAGRVWLDNKSGKDSSTNGLYDENDNLLNGIEVWLYEIVDENEYNQNNEKIHKYLKIEGENGKDKTYLKIADLGYYDASNSNPQLTRNIINTETNENENGRYSFKGVNPTKKYMVVFIYDGMLFTNTSGEAQEYNSKEWTLSSKISELINERDILNNRFREIESKPAGYKISKNIFENINEFTTLNYLNYLTKKGNEYYNQVYNLKSEEVVKYKEEIRKQLEDYLSKNNTSMDNSMEAYVLNIYKPIIDRKVDIQDKAKAMSILQFIWDCRLNAYSGEQSVKNGVNKLSKTYYPYYNKFILLKNNLQNNLGNDLRNKRGTSDSISEVNGYFYIYRGQLYINLGLVQRETTELTVTEDLAYVTISINGKDEKNTYNALNEDRSLTVYDYNYVHYVTDGDYSYSTVNDLTNVATYPTNNGPVQKPIQIYATYKIIVKNSSNVATSIDELVTYFDRYYYSYSDKYATTSGKELKGVYAKYYNNVKKTTEDINNISANKESKCINSAIYGDKDIFDMRDLAELYLSIGNDQEKILLENQDKLYVYITYRLGEDSTNDNYYNCTYSKEGGNSAQNILQKEIGNTTNKINTNTYVELNKYSTYVNDYYEYMGTDYTYYSLNKNKYRAGGYLDTYSIPGNLNKYQKDVGKNEQPANTWEIDKDTGYEKGNITTTEYDWDHGASLILQRPDEKIERTLAGNVWETKEEASYYIGESNSNYPRFESAQKVKNITVELIEIKDGKEYVRARTSTDDNGGYKFERFIPGDYVVRFTYGDKAVYDTVQYSEYRTYSIDDKTYKCAYNGEFYQSARTNPNTNNAKYWYNEDADTRYSDASDEVNIRKYVNDILKDGYTYVDITHVTKNPTEYMVYAYTSLIEVEVEYAATERNGSNPAYTINNIDFGLTPRTESKLDISKEVKNIKLILQDGTVKFNVTPEKIREQGVAGVVQANRGSNIHISMSNELLSGATIEITYEISATNNSKYDSVTYYKDNSNKLVAVSLYEELPTALVSYENGTFRKHNNIDISKISTGDTEVVSYDTNKTERIITTTTPTVVADFISNNLTFSKTSYTGEKINEYWDVYNADNKDVIADTYYRIKVNDKELQPSNMQDHSSEELYDYSNIVLANANNPLLAKKLRGGESSSAEIVLSKVISTGNDLNTYKNYVRLLGISNTVSRIQDLKTDTSETISITDPTGTSINYIIIVLTLVVAIIIGVGIIFIKKFVLDRR